MAENTAENMLLGYADDLAGRVTQKRKPVIDPDSNTVGDVMEIFPETVTVMDPRSLYVQDSKGIIDIRNTPQLLQELGTAIGSNVEVESDVDVETTVVEREIKDNSELNETMIKVARLIDIKMDELTDTVRLQSNRQLEEMRLTTTAVTQLKDTQIQDSELAKKLQKERLDFERERDFDKNRPIATPDNPLPVTPYGQEEMPPEEQGGPSVFDGLFGVGGGRGRAGRLGRIGRIVGLVGRSLFGLAGVLLIANEVVKKFFGKDLITFVKDGFKYLLDNWDTLLMKGFDMLFDTFKALPGMIGDAVMAIGTTIKAVLLSIFEKIPFLKDMFDIPDTFDEIHDSITGKNEQTGSAISGGTTALMGGAATAGAAVYGAKKLRASMQSPVPARETFGEQAGQQGKPENGKMNSSTKGGMLRKAGKFGMLLSAALAVTSIFGDDEEAAVAATKPSADSSSEPTLPTANESMEVMRDESSSMSSALASAAVLGGGAYMMNRKPETVAKVTPDKTGAVTQQPKPVTGNLPDKQATAATAKGGKGLLKTLGRVPGLSMLFAGMDVYNTANDDTLSQQEKNVQYAGAGGTLAGGAAGAALGATVGSIIPGFGTLIGGTLGGLAGAYLGEEGVESIANYFMGPEPSEGQQALETGVGSENVTPQEEPFFHPGEDKEFLELWNSDPKDLMEGSIRVPEVAPIKETEYTPVDMTDQAVADKTQDIIDKSAGTVSSERAQAMARQEMDQPEVNQVAAVKTNVEPTTVNRNELDMMPGPSYTEQPNVEEVPNIETGLARGETLRDQSPIQPDINVTVAAPAAERPKPVAKTTRPKIKERGTSSGYASKPALNNVPVTIEDSTFKLIELGYV